MQNEPKFRKSQVNVNKVLTKDYEKNSNWTLGENEPKTNPNEPKPKKAEMNVTSYITVGYENKPPIWAPKKQSQTSNRQKPMQTSLPQRIMKKTALLASDKTKPNKPNQTQLKPMLVRHQCGGTKEKCRHGALKTVKIRRKKESRNKP
jgi:hypothetical protein